MISIVNNSTALSAASNVLGRFQVPVDKSFWLHTMQVRHSFSTLKAPTDGVPRRVMRLATRSMQHCKSIHEPFWWCRTKRFAGNAGAFWQQTTI